MSAPTIHKHWPYHLQMAEKPLPCDERENNDKWKELWKLVVKFLCDSPEVFKTWQRAHMELPDPPYYHVDRTFLRSLHVAAVYGLTGLAEMLIKRGESAKAETDDGRQPLWFAAEHDIELLKLLLDNGADPKSRKDYPPPFHRLLWLNPKLEG